jgi:hypothetical protein
MADRSVSFPALIWIFAAISLGACGDSATDDTARVDPATDGGTASPGDQDGAVAADGAVKVGDDGGPSTPPASYCARWKDLAKGDLPGFATDSACADYDDIPTGDVPCSGAKNDSAVVALTQLAQNHLITPTSDDYKVNDKGEALDPGGVRPKFRLASERPVLVKVNVTGAGPSPEVKVTASRNGKELGSLCLKGPSALPASVSATPPSLDDSFSATLPGAWIHAGLALTITAGGATKSIPATDLRVAGGLRHQVVELPMLVFGDTTPHYVPQYMPRMADELPVKSLVWSHFPVPVELNPFTMSARGNNPVRVVAQRGGDFDEVGECLDIVGELRAANG